jgi:hypothetical protein
VDPVVAADQHRLAGRVGQREAEPALRVAEEVVVVDVRRVETLLHDDAGDVVELTHPRVDGCVTNGRAADPEHIAMRIRAAQDVEHLGDELGVAGLPV